MNKDLPDVQTGFRKDRGIRDQTANMHLIMEKATEFQKKTFTSASLTMIKPLILSITKNLWKIIKEVGVLGHLTYP